MVILNSIYIYTCISIPLHIYLFIYLSTYLVEMLILFVLTLKCECMQGGAPGLQAVLHVGKHKLQAG